MSEDTKQDKSQKEPLTRSEYHGVITSYAGLVMSLIAIVLSVITMYQSHIMETREAVQILRAEDDGYYHFDGETLFKNFQVTVANNSAIPVSVVEIAIERDEEVRTFKISDLPDILPLNMGANYTEMITIPWQISLSHSDKVLFNISHIRDKQIHDDQKNSDTESELLISSRRRQTWENMNELLTEYSRANFPELDESEISRRVSAVLWLYGYAYDKGYNQKIVPLSITLRTAKDNQYALATEDMGAPESASSEGSWVAQLFLSKTKSLWDTSEDSTELNQEE